MSELSQTGMPTYEELYNLAFIRGTWVCPKCDFQLHKATICYDGVGTSETDRQSEPCPNDGEWMVPGTYKAVAESLSARIDEFFLKMDLERQRADKLSQLVRAIEKAAFQTSFPGVTLGSILGLLTAFDRENEEETKATK